MRLSTVFVASALVLSGFAVAYPGDLYTRSFNADVITELKARAFHDDDVGLYLRSVLSGGATGAVEPSDHSTGSGKQPKTPSITSEQPKTPSTSDSAKQPKTLSTTGDSNKGVSDSDWKYGEGEKGEKGSQDEMSEKKPKKKHHGAKKFEKWEGKLETKFERKKKKLEKKLRKKLRKAKKLEGKIRDEEGTSPSSLAGLVGLNFRAELVSPIEPIRWTLNTKA